MNRFFRPIGILIAIDQGIKLLLYLICYEKLYLLPYNVIGLYPRINQHLSLVGNFIPFFRMPPLIILINIVAILFCILAYRFQQFLFPRRSRWAELTYIVALSGCLCSLIDKVFWGGSLDYILFFELILFDLKDVYVLIALVLLIFFLIKEKKELTWQQLGNYFRTLHKKPIDK